MTSFMNDAKKFRRSDQSLATSFLVLNRRFIAIDGTMDGWKGGMQNWFK